MGLHDVTHIDSATVADLNCFAVKKFVKWVMRGGVSVQDAQEFSADIGF